MCTSQTLSNGVFENEIRIVWALWWLQIGPKWKFWFKYPRALGKTAPAYGFMHFYLELPLPYGSKIWNSKKFWTQLGKKHPELGLLIWTFLAKDTGLGMLFEGLLLVRLELLYPDPASKEEMVTLQNMKDDSRWKWVLKKMGNAPRAG